MEWIKGNYLAHFIVPDVVIDPDHERIELAITFRYGASHEGMDKTISLTRQLYYDRFWDFAYVLTV